MAVNYIVRGKVGTGAAAADVQATELTVRPFGRPMRVRVLGQLAMFANGGASRTDGLLVEVPGLRRPPELLVLWYDRDRRELIANEVLEGGKQ